MFRHCFGLAPLFVAAFLAAAGPASAGASVDNIRAGTVPEPDSPEEAEVCALESFFVSVAFSQMDGVEPETLQALNDHAEYWLERAAAIHGQKLDAYIENPEFVADMQALMDVDTDTQIAVAETCVERMGD